MFLSFSFNSDVCLTEACVIIASNVLSSMDKSVDPCENFHQYSCGGWYKNNMIPDGRTKWNTFLSLYSENQYVLKNILGKYTSLVYLYLSLIICFVLFDLF